MQYFLYFCILKQKFNNLLMEKLKILYISQEITPYLPESEISNICRYLPQGIQEQGNEIRTFMPRFGKVNERRNQLHEVIRLSGMNLVINDTDHPLIIKVASIQAARMQVYFIDNEDFFSRKFVFTDEKGNFFKDNDERTLFFTRGVFETVKKLRWSPDIIHCHGWFTGIIPIYLKKIFYDDPLFLNSKIIYSVYNDEFKGSLNKDFSNKILFEGLKSDDVKPIKNATHENITKLAIDYSDAVIKGSKEINPNIDKYLKSIDKPVLSYKNDKQYIDAYSVFYHKLANSK